MFLDLRPDLVAGIGDQPGRVGGRITVEQPGAHLREQVGGHRLLAVKRTPLITLDKEVVSSLDPGRHGVGWNTQQRPQGRGASSISVA